MNIIVSACLLGTCCRYDGKDNKVHTLSNLPEGCHLIPVCPEQLGGLPTPRVPAERRHHRVYTKEGLDVTKEFTQGAEEALKLAKQFHCKLAILKERSPSCGKGMIYDGSFQKRLIEGNGLTTDLLIKNGIEVIGESMIETYFHLGSKEEKKPM